MNKGNLSKGLKRIATTMCVKRFLIKKKTTTQKFLNFERKYYIKKETNFSYVYVFY